jgi:hypothetical protein
LGESKGSSRICHCSVPWLIRNVGPGPGVIRPIISFLYQISSSGEYQSRKGAVGISLV